MMCPRMRFWLVLGILAAATTADARNATGYQNGEKNQIKVVEGGGVEAEAHNAVAVRRTVKAGGMIVRDPPAVVRSQHRDREHAGGRFRRVGELPAAEHDRPVTAERLHPYHLEVEMSHAGAVTAVLRLVLGVCLGEAAADLAA